MELPHDVWLLVVGRLDIAEVRSLYFVNRELHHLLQAHEPSIAKHALRRISRTSLADVEDLFAVESTYASLYELSRKVSIIAEIERVVLGRADPKFHRCLTMLLIALETASHPHSLSKQFQQERDFLASLPTSMHGILVQLCYDYELCIGAIFLTLPESRVFGAVAMQRAANYYMLQGMQQVVALFRCRYQQEKVRERFNGIVKRSSNHVLFITESNYIYGQTDE